ncbi:hypothetical protein, partial [Bradyrhizobium liaoningense]|uniref:hypothetical protein n=1 Tax=Bradyrhizobium liaoningense TaxID=43992 RepID=UPI001BA7F103
RSDMILSCESAANRESSRPTYAKPSHVRGSADDPGASVRIGAVATDQRFQNQYEFLGKHLRHPRR